MASSSSIKKEMRKVYKKIWIIVISVILILTISGSVVAKEILSAKIELKDGTVIVGEISIILVKTKDGKFIKVEDIVSIWFLTETPSVNSSEKLSKETESFTWDRQEGIIVTATGNRVEGCDEFVKELRKVLHVSRWGSVTLLDFTENKKDLESMRNRHTIFTIRPENLEELEKLEAKHPDLLPLSCSKLKSYSFPLLYFSRDDNGKIRGVIIIDEVTPLLAKLLTESALPLDIPLDERLEKK